MATNIDPTLVNSLLECSICLEEFHDPRSLPCLHSFCLKCLKTHTTRRDTDGNFRCPQCREKCVIPEGGVEDFPRNFFANTLKDIMPAASMKHLGSQEPAATAQCANREEGQEGEDVHGSATVFCVECDAYFCDHCSDSHKLFRSMKGHTVQPVTEVKVKVPEHGLHNPKCDRHPGHQIDWYCKTCALPACSSCILEEHKTHDTEKLSVVATSFRTDVQDVSKMAAKRIIFLQQISTELNTSRMKMEEDFDQASKDITGTAEDMRNLITRHETELQGKLNKLREAARKQMEIAQEELEISQASTVSLKSSAEVILNPETTDLFMALQAPIAKKQFIHQQETSVPNIDWDSNSRYTKPGELSKASFLGSAEMEASVESMETCDEEDEDLGDLGDLGDPIQTKLQYTGENAVCAIAPIHKTLLCVAHFGDEGIWVYTDAGQLKQKIQIPSIDKVDGIVAVNQNQGNLAIVDGTQCKIHLVTLSVDLEVLQHTTKEVPFVPNRLNMSNNRELVVNNITKKQFAILTADGSLVKNVEVLTPGNIMNCVALTRSGYVVCGKPKKSVYFTDGDGHILHTSTDCEDPWHGVQTSWGHVLVVEHFNRIKVFSELGEFLGSMQDYSGAMISPYRMHIDEADRFLYVGCGVVGKMEVRKYKFSASDLPPLPVKCDVTKLTMTLDLTDVHV